MKMAIVLIKLNECDVVTAKEVIKLEKIADVTFEEFRNEALEIGQHLLRLKNDSHWYMKIVRG